MEAMTAAEKAVAANVNNENKIKKVRKDTSVDIVVLIIVLHYRHEDDP